MSSDVVADLVARHLPHRRAATVRRLGEGLDNTAFMVDGDLVVRLSKADDPAATVRREAALLAVVASVSTVAVPEPVFVDERAGAMAYPMLPGVPLLGRSVVDAGRLGATLGGFVGALVAVGESAVAGLVEREEQDLDAALADAVGDYETVHELLAPPLREGAERFLAATPPAPATSLVLCHNDLGAEHVLADPTTGEVRGVIDWTDAAVTDPAYDMGLILRDLGSATYAAAAGAYPGPWGEAEARRALFHARRALLEDLAYGVEAADERYVHNALSRWDDTFAPR